MSALILLSCKEPLTHDKKIMVSGCFTYHGVGRLHRIEGIMDAKVSKNTLINQYKPSMHALFPNGGAIFRQDNDPRHKAKDVIAYIESQQWEILEWPAQSPDLNPRTYGI
jgi:hypothetical protein